MASPAQWTWVWARSRRWWRTGKPGVLQSMGSQRVRHDLATEHQCHLLQASVRLRVMEALCSEIEASLLGSVELAWEIYWWRHHWMGRWAAISWQTQRPEMLPKAGSAFQNQIKKEITMARLKEEKGMTEGEMVGWHHQLSGPEFEQTHVSLTLCFFCLKRHWACCLTNKKCLWNIWSVYSRTQILKTSPVEIICRREAAGKVRIH